MHSIFIAALLFLPAPQAAAQDAPSAEERIKSLEDRLAKIEGAPAKASISAFNPAMGMALDLFYRNSDREDKSNFVFRAAELNVEAPIDPFLKGWAIITGSNQGVDIEEATLETTSLPYNLT